MGAPVDPLLRKLSPYVRLAHDFPTSAFNLPLRKINDHALLYFKEGHGTFSIRDKVHPIRPGTLFLCRPGVPHSFNGQGAPFYMLNIHFDLIEHKGCEKIHYHVSPRGRLARPNIEVLSEDTLPSVMHLTLSASYERLFQRVHHFFLLQDPASLLSLKGAMFDLLAFLFKQTQAQHISPALHEQLPHLERAVAYMRTHYGKSLSHEELAKQAGMSPSYFARCFKQYYQVPPVKFLTQVRLEMAKSELTFGRRPIKEVSSLVGFQSVHHFTRTFSQAIGISPAAFRAAYGATL